MGVEESPRMWMNFRPSLDKFRIALPTALRLTSLSSSPLRIRMVRLATAALSRMVRVEVCPLISPRPSAFAMAVDASWNTSSGLYDATKTLVSRYAVFIRSPSLRRLSQPRSLDLSTLQPSFLQTPSQTSSLLPQAASSSHHL